MNTKMKSKKSQAKKQSNSPSNMLDLQKLAAAVKAATSAIAAVQESLPLDNDLTARARKVAQGFQFVKTGAFTAAATVLDNHGDLFPTVDVEQLRSIAQFETTLKAVAIAAESLKKKVETTILKRRQPAAEQVFFMHATLKAKSRTDGTVLDAVNALAPLVNSRKHPHRRLKATIGATPNAPVAHPNAPAPAAVVNGVSTSVGSATPSNGAAKPITNGANAPAVPLLS